MTRAVLLMLLVISLLGPLVMSWRLQWGLPAPPLAGPPLTLSVAAGILFGVGMVLAGSCGGSSFWRLGEGQLTQLPILAGFLGGVWIYELLGPIQLQRFEAEMGWAYALALTGIPLLGLWWRERRLAAPGEELPLRTGLPGLRRSWRPAIGALVTAGLLVATLALTGEFWRVSRAFKPGDIVSVIFVLGLVVGGALGAIFGREWRLQKSGTRKQQLLRSAGGLLMGFGANMGSGCTFGALMGGLLIGSVSGWLWLAGSIVGSWLGVFVLRRLL